MWHLYYQGQSLQDFPMFFSCGYDIDPGRVDAAVAKHICQFGDIPAQAVKDPGEQFSQVVREHLARIDLRLSAEFFHSRPDIAPVEWIS